eukprot:7876002-Pyramimonas_sp.AAC.1
MWNLREALRPMLSRLAQRAHERIGTHSYVDGRPTEIAPVFPPSLDSADTIIYFYDSPRKASES